MIVIVGDVVVMLQAAVIWSGQRGNVQEQASGRQAESIVNSKACVIVVYVPAHYMRE
jgi:hypothetical protein